MSTSNLEPELDQPFPRRMRAREGCGYGCGLWFFRLFMMPHTIIGVWILFKAISAIVMTSGVMLAGQDVDGKIVRKVETQGKKGPYYSADYIYVVERVQYEATVSLDANQYAALREGQAITVKVYAPGVDFGHWPGVPGYSAFGAIGGTVFAALFWNAIMSVFVYMLYVRPWRLRQLVRWGWPTEGIVRHVHRYMNKGTKMVQVRYEYVVPPDAVQSGGVFTGKTSGTGPAAEAFHVGSIVTVLYDPRRPKRNLLYALADFKAVTAPTGQASGSPVSPSPPETGGEG
jgi:Protein of unknown function (DUF3592)